MVGQIFASGNWVVRDGKAEEFVARWTEFLEWTRDNVTGFEFARLIRDEHNPLHFVSFAHWKDVDARASWRQTLGFEERFKACRALCDDFSGGDFTAVATV